MQQNFIDGNTNQPRRFGELYSDRNMRLTGEARYSPGTSQIETRGLKFISTPVNGGSEAVTIVPDALYALATAEDSIWLQFRRTSGTSTATLGVDLLIVPVGTQPPPKENWVQIFYRSSAVGEVVSFGSFMIGVTPTWTRIGISRGNSIYDAVVGPTVGDPYVTHTSIQAAINECVDGNRILVLEGTYLITAATGYSPTSALSWTGKTLTIEGEGNGTIIRNGGAFPRAFSIQSSDAGFAALRGNGSRLLNLQLQAFNQSVQFDGGTGFGIRNCDVNLNMTDFVIGSYVSPAVVGTGTSEQNSVREKIVATAGTAQERYTIASSTLASNITRVEAAGTITHDETVTFGRSVTHNGPSVTHNGTVLFTRPTSGFGQLPLGSVIATFPNLAGAYNCTATTVADAATGLVLCNGQTIADVTSPMNGAVIPNINNDVFLAGNTTSGVTGGVNSQTSTVNIANLTVVGTSGGSTVTWVAGTNAATAGGGGSFAKNLLNSNQISHSHSGSAMYGDAWFEGVDLGGTAAINVWWNPRILGSNRTLFSLTQLVQGGGDNTGQGPVSISNVSNRAISIQGSTGTASVNWSAGSTVTISASAGTMAKNQMDSNQNSHSHGVGSYDVGGSAAVVAWNNRPLYITAKYCMRVK